MQILRRCAFFLILWNTPTAFTAPVQETIHFASISGRLTDPGGAAVAGARVVARHTDTNVAVEAETGADGRFRFPYLRVGHYELTATAANLFGEPRRLTLSAGATLEIPIGMSLGTIATALTVTQNDAPLEAARTQIVGTVSHEEKQALPFNGRSSLDLALLVPGVSPPNVGGGTQLFAETSAVPGVGLSINSQRNLSNNFVVDGLSANDDAAALSGISFGLDAIEEFQVITSGGQAELGRALGGFLNLVTRSGTNTLAGNAYTFFRDDSLNGANALSGTKLPMRQYQSGASLGGPIVQDRMFFFTNVEERRMSQPGLTTIPVETVDAINQALTSFGYGGPPVATGAFRNPIDTTHLLAKVDHHVSARNQLSVRYSLYRADSHNSRGAGGPNAPSASAGVDNLDQTIAFGNLRTLGGRTILETRGQFAHSNLSAPPADAIGPAVSISGVAAFGMLSSSPTVRLNRMVQLVNNFSRHTGAQAIRAGADFLYNRDIITFPRARRGSYTFSSLSNFLAGTYTNQGFTQTFGDTVVAQSNPNLGIYVQNGWRVSSGLTINGGVRYDLQHLETIRTDRNNVAPRLGFAWAPFAGRRMLIRGGAGRFYDRVPLRALANAMLSAGNTTNIAELRQIAVSLSPSQTGAPTFPNTLSAVVPTTTLVNLTTMDRNIQNAYSDQFNVEVEQQFGSTMTASLSYQRVRGRLLIMQINQNVPACAASGGNNGCRPIPDYANNNQYSSAGSSVYDGLSVSILRRPSRWGSYRISYTYSKSMNNVGEAFFNSPIDPFDVSKDWGRADSDQRHRLVVSGTLAAPSAGRQGLIKDLTRGFQLSGTLVYYSALPFNITTGTNTIQGTAGRPTVNGVFIPRNAGLGGDFSTVSLRLSRVFTIEGRLRIEALAEGFNVFNRRNNLARIGVFGSGTYPDNPALNFQQITAVGEPRAAQFGLRLSY